MEENDFNPQGCRGLILLMLGIALAVIILGVIIF